MVCLDELEQKSCLTSHSYMRASCGDKILTYLGLQVLYCVWTCKDIWIHILNRYIMPVSLRHDWQFLEYVQSDCTVDMPSSVGVHLRPQPTVEKCTLRIRQRDTVLNGKVYHIDASSYYLNMKRLALARISGFNFSSSSIRIRSPRAQYRTRSGPWSSSAGDLGLAFPSHTIVIFQNISWVLPPDYM